jgi:hypothetical protein
LALGAALKLLDFCTQGLGERRQRHNLALLFDDQCQQLIATQ